MKPELLALDNAIFHVLGEIEHWLELRDGISFTCRYKRVDQLKLLQLYGWELKYKLPIVEILDMIVPVLRALIRSKKKYRGLGLMVRSLVGDGAENILKKEIAKLYPHGEHIQIWKSRERDLHLEREVKDDLEGVEQKDAAFKGILGYESVQIYLARYKRRVDIARKRELKASLSNRRKRKAYRWNCWR